MQYGVIREDFCRKEKGTPYSGRIIDDSQRKTGNGIESAGA